MHPAFVSSTPVLFRRHTALRAVPCPVVTVPAKRPSQVMASASRIGNPLRNLAVLATAAIALRLPVPAAAAAPVVAPIPVTAQISSSRPALSTAIRARPAGLSVAAVTAPVSIMDRAGFWAGEFLMWNPAARVIALLGVTLVCMYFGSFLYRMADPQRKEASSPFWHSVRAIANPLEDDWDNNALRTTSIALAGIGMIVFAIMVGMVTESVESAVQNVDGEMSRVVVSNHVLVCGWSPHVSAILKDVHGVKDLKVVVLAKPEHKQLMMDDLKETFTAEDRKRVRIFYRPGAPIAPEDLDRVGAARASKIIIVNDREGSAVDADRKVLSRALAIRKNLPDFKGDIVAEINNVRDEDILRSILATTKARSVETVNADQLLFRFMAQAIRQPGLADVVANLMGDNPAYVFHVKSAKEAAPQLVGSNYSDLRPSSVPGSVLCGFYDRSGKVHIGTSQPGGVDGTTLRPDTNLLLLGNVSGPGTSQDGHVLLFSPSTASRMQKYGQKLVSSDKRCPESYLVCGWRDDMEAMLNELDGILSSGSKITILDEDTPDSILQKFKNLSITCVKNRPDVFENLEEILSTKAKPFDHVVLLGSVFGDNDAPKSRLSQDEDTNTLASLVYVNNLLKKQQAAAAAKKQDPIKTLVTAEFVSERVAAMAKEQENVTTAILPQNLSAKIAAQTVRESRLNAVWRELLSQKGREVYLRPCGMYKDMPKGPASFTTVADQLAKSADDVVIGYVHTDGRVIINPQQANRFKNRVWDTNDMLIVLSEK